MALPGYPGKKRYGYHPPGRRRKSGKLLRRALYQTVYSWSPFEPDLWKNIDPIDPIVDECCLHVCDETIDPCVTYVYGGKVLDINGCIIDPVGGAYVECDYVE
jgi:hypothetical protein|tara:strand:+ start:257 stop:565 length:309 start_codon:yes stop_codon:yes gene_type:complete